MTKNWLIGNLVHWAIAKQSAALQYATSVMAFKLYGYSSNKQSK
jgi:hypothetical protein